MTDIFLANIAGAGLSLLFSYVPGFRDRFQGFSGDGKRLVMLGLLALAALVIYGLGCLGYYQGITCDQAGIQKMLTIFFAALVTNQSTFALSPNGSPK